MMEGRFKFWILVFAFTGARAWGQVTCSPDDLRGTADDVKAVSCVTTCQKVFKKSAGPYFEKNCRQFEAQPKPMTMGEVASGTTKVLDQALLQCLPLAAKKAVVETYEFVKALPSMVAYLLNSSQRATAWKACQQSADCKRAMARNTFRYQEKNIDGSWKIPDAEVDRQIASSDLNSLWVQATHDRPRSREDCGRRWGDIRRTMPNGPNGEFDVNVDQKVYEALVVQAPHCPGVLNLPPPLFRDGASKSASAAPAPAPAAPSTKAECYKTKDPLDCMSTLEMLAVGQVCLGPDFEKLKIDLCADVAKVLMPLPLIGPQTKMLPKLARAETAAATEVKAVAGELKAASGEAASSATASTASAVTVKNGEIVTVPAAVESAKTAAASAAKVPPTAQVKSFVDNYKERVFVSEEQNRRYMKIAEATSAAPSGKTRFFDVENSVMKKLNDTTGDKNLVTSLTNFQKENVMKRLEALKTKYPGVNFEVYSDFKSVKIAVQSEKEIDAATNAKIFADLEGVYKQSNKEFAGKVKELGIDVKAAGEPEQWFKAGYGATVDEAALAARRARQEGGAGVATLDGEAGRAAEQRLQQVESQRVQLAQSEAMAPLLEKNAAGQALPRQDVFDLARKANSNEELAAAVSKRYGLTNFTATEAAQLQSYVKGVDEFSPTVLIAKRENVNFDKSPMGGASADFLGLGSANLKETASGIAGKTKVSEALTGAREGERRVTQAFQSRMEKFKKTVGGEVTCSGDDCIRAATAPLSEKEKSKIMRALARDPETRNVRMSFVGPNVPAEARMQLSSHGEAIEKAFRKELEGHIDFAKLDKMTFGFDMQTVKLNEGNVNLIVGNSSRLTAAEKNELQQAFARALEKYNQAGRGYTQGSARANDYGLRLVPGPGALLTSDEAP